MDFDTISEQDEQFNCELVLKCQDGVRDVMDSGSEEFRCAGEGRYQDNEVVFFPQTGKATYSLGVGFTLLPPMFATKPLRQDNQQVFF